MPFDALLSLPFFERKYGRPVWLLAFQDQFWLVKRSSVSSVSGTGYCIPQEVQAHSRSCSATTSQGQGCQSWDICFSEIQQHWRHLLTDSDVEEARTHNRSNLEKAVRLDSKASAEDPLRERMALPDAQMDQGICVGIR